MHVCSRGVAALLRRPLPTQILVRREERRSTHVEAEPGAAVFAGKNITMHTLRHAESIRVPLVVRYPGLVAPKDSRVIEEISATIDFAPSILTSAAQNRWKKFTAAAGND